MAKSLKSVWVSSQMCNLFSLVGAWLAFRFDFIALGL